MIGELILRADAAWAVLVVCAVGTAAALAQLWWSWFTLWPQGCCGKPARVCRCPRYRRVDGR